MTHSKEIGDLGTLSQTIGCHPEYVQGGGGNISVKLDEKRMAIKASGWLLSNVSVEDGYSIVDYQGIRNYLQKPNKNEDLFTNKIKSFVLETGQRPSIETGFHALINKTYVIHTHSVFANILNCSKEGKEILSDLFPTSCWIPYATPGRDLTLRIKELIQDSHSIIFLQNHGLIVSAEESKEAYKMHENVNDEIVDYLDLSKIFDKKDTANDIDFLKRHVLFPDQVVYTSADKDLLKTEAAMETLAAYKYILATIQDLGLTPQFITNEQANILLNLESEKHRQEMIK